LLPKTLARILSTASDQVLRLRKFCTGNRRPPVSGRAWMDVKDAAAERSRPAAKTSERWPGGGMPLAGWYRDKAARHGQDLSEDDALVWEWTALTRRLQPASTAPQCAAFSSCGGMAGCSSTPSAVAGTP
jgi:hypothetical protein